jgi:hypothetical protein
MAEEKKEKSNFYIILAACAIASITLVLVLKGRETEHLSTGPAASIEESAAAIHDAARYENNFE